MALCVAKVGGAEGRAGRVGAEGQNHDADSNHDVVTASDAADSPPTEKAETADGAPAAARLPYLPDVRRRRAGGAAVGHCREAERRAAASRDKAGWIRGGQSAERLRGA